MGLFARNGSRHMTQEALSEYMDGRLSASAASALERHTAGCAACRSDLESLRATRALLAELPTVPVPRSFRVRPPEPASLPLWQRLLPPLRIATAASAALFVAAVGLNIGVPATPHPASLTAAPALESARDQRASAGAGAGSGATSAFSAPDAPSPPPGPPAAPAAPPVDQRGAPNQTAATPSAGDASRTSQPQTAGTPSPAATLQAKAAPEPAQPPPPAAGAQPQPYAPETSRAAPSSPPLPSWPQTIAAVFGAFTALLGGATAVLTLRERR